MLLKKRPQKRQGLLIPLFFRPALVPLLDRNPFFYQLEIARAARRSRYATRF
jgi:hypothetical protein